MNFLVNVNMFDSLMQARSPTGVHGKAASGALHEAMSSPDTSGSTLEQSHSNAVTATGEPVHIHENLGEQHRNGSQGIQRLFCGNNNCELLFDFMPPSEESLPNPSF